MAAAAVHELKCHVAVSDRQRYRDRWYLNCLIVECVPYLVSMVQPSSPGGGSQGRFECALLSDLILYFE